MRHGKKINHLGRTSSHRKAMLSNMASSLILNKRISTTVARAKELRKYIEPLLTKAKSDTTHSRRVVFSYLNDKESIKILFDEVAEKIASRPGGYTRIIKTGTRLGDNAEMCIMELVDYNELLLKDAKPAKSKKRSRRGGKSKKGSDAVAAAPQVEEAVETKEEATEVAEVVAEEQEVTEAEVAEEVQEAAAETAEVVEEKAAEEVAEPAEAKEEVVDEEPAAEVVEEAKDDSPQASAEATEDEKTADDSTEEDKGEADGGDEKTEDKN
ncbi:50S ribosomal protein L17 [Fulvivirgaceae bacterium BMA12]|uniref:Large ribosomal subunit protein bL17 n=1 Tax=Agaribacillus aureus TaxID=3051825 RepID=A0ABT8L3L7_9BACT|nr:50S ribosomal protein L17 [Fulvivirgaceae bacterium BMA12]